MANKRMFSKQIVDSDAFLDMPVTSQLLYFHLNMQADDDGFVGNPKKIIRMMGANDDDFKILIVKRFILTFQSGVMVIKHWKLHNYIQNDRYYETQYLDEKKTLNIKENGSYTECIQNVSNLDSEVRLDKDRLDKIRLDKVSEETPAQQFKNFLNKPEPVIQELLKKGLPEEPIRQEIVKFISYWTELNKSGTKQRWELEKTFELPRRLNKWFSNINQFKKTTNVVLEPRTRKIIS